MTRRQRKRRYEVWARHLGMPVRVVRRGLRIILATRAELARSFAAEEERQFIEGPA